ncbi:glycine N-acyltransferase-like [Sabethes cyaneus]|uniref:glycine N-acyltransferase-like n=1 Tax=Sabethes cyaneus TaxID=53552 RepID=UPI00237DFAA8|nr:glycine N-acyltransferase-like [Sabethes cyaneus]
MSSSGVLEQLDCSDLRQLKLILQNNLLNYEIACRTVQNYIVWLDKEPDLSEEVNIFSLNKNWESDGTFIILDSIHLYIHAYSFYDNFDSLKQSLLLLDWSHSYTVCMLSTKFKEIILDTFHDLGIQIALFTDDFIYHLPKEVAMKIQIDVPTGFRLAALESHHAAQIDRNWEHRTTGTEAFIRRLIAYNATIGLLIESTDQLIGWCLQSCCGEMALLHVDPEFRRQGFGSLLIKACARRLATEGQPVYANITSSNEPSQKLFLSVGFLPRERVHWVVNEAKKS